MGTHPIFESDFDCLTEMPVEMSSIARAAGPDLLKECRKLNGCETGEAEITGGYRLPAKHVIHTVGPMGEKEILLADAYRNSLTVAYNEELSTIAFPCISTGVY